jgi:hypothetical protein
MAQKTAYSTAARKSSHTTNRITLQDYPCPVKHFVVYTLLRLGLFVATYAVLAAPAVLIFGNKAMVLFVTLVVAALISSLLSLRLLAGPRERFAESVEARAARARDRFEEMRSREDAE